MKTVLLSTIAALGLGTAALADSVTLSKPFEGYRLTTGNVDLIAYQTDLGDGGFEVTAYTRARNAHAQPERVMMRLENDDSVTFAMPSEPRILYTFARRGDVVTVASRPVPLDVAAY